MFNKVKKKSANKTINVMFNTDLMKHNSIQPITKNTLFEMNNLIMFFYHFMRLYTLSCYYNNNHLPEIDDTFILHCIKILGVKNNNALPIDNVKNFYIKESQPITNHNENKLKKISFVLTYLAAHIHLFLSNNAHEYFIQHFLGVINKTITTNVITDIITNDNSVLSELNNQVMVVNNQTNEIFDAWKTNNLLQKIKNHYFNMMLRQLK